MFLGKDSSFYCETCFAEVPAVNFNTIMPITYASVRGWRYRTLVGDFVEGKC